MKHIGQLLKSQIESRRLKKCFVAEKAGLTANYLSILFTKRDITCSQWEKLCFIVGISPGICFDDYIEPVLQKEQDGLAACIDRLKAENVLMQKLLNEKDRTIGLLLARNNGETN